MRFLVIGDERVELNYLEKILHDSIPDCDLICFDELSEALEYIADTQTDLLISRDDKKNHKKNRKKIQISCFGEFSIYYDGIPVHLSSKKAYELIAYLIIHHGHPVSKWEAALRLWENSEDFRARDSLYKVLKKIKQTEKEIGCSLVCSKKQKIYLEKDKIQCTLWEFEELYQNKSIANYEKAQQLFKEMLFGGEAYSWIMEEEGRYELMYMEILENLLEHYQKKKKYHRIGYYQKLLGMKGGIL